VYDGTKNVIGGLYFEATSTYITSVGCFVEPTSDDDDANQYHVELFFIETDCSFSCCIE
jgi:hypothetical protein